MKSNEGRTKPRQGDTQVMKPVPRLPHERDESSDSHDDGEPRPLMRKAHDDVAQGRVDTDRGTPMNETYERQKEEAVRKKT